MDRNADHELMTLHVETLFVHDDRGDLLRVNEPNGAPAPRFFLGRMSRGHLVRFRADVGPADRAALTAAVETQDNQSPGWVTSRHDSVPFERILARSAPVQATWLGFAYRVEPGASDTTGAVMVGGSNAEILRDLLGAWIPDVQTGQPVVALVVDGRAVSVCCSVRRTALAHEAGVETAPAYRGRGYASRVVSAWAAAVRDLGCVPLYSTGMHNVASWSVANKLSMLHFGIDLHVT